ncbi:MAG: twin-arginine translocase subunit TatC [Alphaproteobacteria bacterium]|nr:twin-arginine translocase subunit TatC [Alphaproteobacteria bacterium]
MVSDKKSVRAKKGKRQTTKPDNQPARKPTTGKGAVDDNKILPDNISPTSDRTANHRPTGGNGDPATDGASAPAGDESGKTKENTTAMSLLAHLIELRKRLLAVVVVLLLAFGFSYYFVADIYNFLAKPLFTIWQQAGDSSTHHMIATSLTEAFFTEVKLAIYTALIITMPFLLFQVWMFVAPGLYRHERTSFLGFLIATPLFFIGGAAFVYFLVMPMAWKFFLSFEQLGQYHGDMAMAIQPRVSEYLSLVLQLVLAFGLSFETPVLLTLLVKLGVISRRWLIDKRRYAIVIAFIAAGILTPPDPLSQISLAVPLILLYEAAIIASYFIERSNKK